MFWAISMNVTPIYDGFMYYWFVYGNIKPSLVVVCERYALRLLTGWFWGVVEQAELYI